MLLEGWVPARNKIEIEAFLDSSHVYYELSDPTPEDNVPIELNNKGFFPGSNRFASSICCRSITNWT